MKKIKILDLSTLIPGPFATFLLEKYLDCEVIKIEDVAQPDLLINMRPTKEGVGLSYQTINEKKSILKVNFTGNGLNIIRRELENVDILIENFKRGRTLKLGLSYEELIKINPKLLYCSISGYSQGTLLENKSAHDLNILALSGYLDQQLKLNPINVLPPLLLADTFTSYHTTMKILAALIKGTFPIHLEVSMHKAFLEAMTINNSPQLTTQKEFSANDYAMSGRLPCYTIYDSKDGGKVAVAAIEKPLWVDFCTHIKRENLIDRQFETEVILEVADEMKKYNREYWLSEEVDFCVTPILSINEVVNKSYV